MNIAFEGALGTAPDGPGTPRAIHIPVGFAVAYDHDLAPSRGFTVTDEGITVIAKTDGVEHLLDDDEPAEFEPAPVEDPAAHHMLS